MKISCCLIIRDEMGNLPRLFASVRPHVDEICVLDTGSTDGSAAWCKEKADKWEQWTGCNDDQGRIADFSAARNRSLAMASHEAVLWLDGDDELVGGSNIRELVGAAPEGSAWSVIARYDYDPNVVQWRERLVYPAKGFEWRGPVHEGLLGKAGCAPQQVQTDAFHVVHRRRESGKVGEPGRNLRILRRWFEANGEADARLMHYLGAELLIAGQVGEARYWFRRHNAVAPWSDERCLSLMGLARVDYAIGDYQEAARWALEAMATKSWPEPCWMLGMAWCALSEQGIDREHNMRRGLHMLERGFKLDGDPATRSLLMIDPLAKYEAYAWFAPALARAGRLDEAIAAAQAGLKGREDALLRQNLHEWKKVKVAQGVLELEQMGAVKADASKAVAAVLAGHFSQQAKPKLLTGAESGRMLREAFKPRPDGKLRIAFYLGHQLEPWTPETLERDGMGGSETMAWEMSKRLAKLGHRVEVYGHRDIEDRRSVGMFEGVRWYDADMFEECCDCDVLIVSRQYQAVHLPHRATARVLWVHDVHVGDTFSPRDAMQYDFIWCLSNWHKEFFLQCYPWLPPSKVEVTRNGIDPARFSGKVERNAHKAIYSSSPDRGLAEAVRAWPMVRVAVPDAELHCYYGWNNWERSLELGGENGIVHCSRDALVALKKAVAETEGVFMHGRVNQRELAQAMLGAGVWFYPTWFSETSCITAMEAQAAGLRCVCPRLAALAETVCDVTWDENDLVGCLTYCMNLGEPDVITPWALKKFDLDTLAESWEARLNKLALDARANVVPAFAEAAQ